MKFELKCFMSLLKALKPHESSFLTSSDLIKQTSVALIFRINPFLHQINNENNKEFQHQCINSIKNYLNALENQTIIENKFDKTKENKQHLLEILLIKRGTHEKDQHKGQIAFPGGKCEEKENDFDAVRREVSEEVGISLNNDYLPLGKLPLNTFAYYTERKSTYISMYMFLELPQKPQIIKINSNEVQKAFWLPWIEFLTVKTLKRDIDFIKGHNYFFRRQWAFNIFNAILLKNFESRVYKVMLLSNNEKIYGLSFCIMMNILGLIRKDMRGNYQKNEEKKMDRILRGCFEFRYFVRRKWLPGNSITKGFLVNKIFYRNRVKQFLI